MGLQGLLKSFYLLFLGGWELRGVVLIKSQANIMCIQEMPNLSASSLMGPSL